MATQLINFYDSKTLRLKSIDDCTDELYTKIKNEKLKQRTFQIEINKKYKCIRTLYFFILTDIKSKQTHITDEINYGEGVELSKGKYKGNLYNIKKDLIASGEITYKHGEFSGHGDAFMMSTHNEFHKFVGSFIVNALSTTLIKGISYYFIYPQTVLSVMNHDHYKSDIFMFHIDETGYVEKVYFNNDIILDEHSFYINLKSRSKQEILINFDLNCSNIRSFINMIYGDLKSLNV